jgi:hypothetical protein
MTDATPMRIGEVAAQAAVNVVQARGNPRERYRRPDLGEDARPLIRRALVDAGLPAQWREWKRDAADTPTALRGLASPTILVHGADVSVRELARGESERANACRVYRHGEQMRGVPPLEAIAAALMGRPRQ